MKRIFLILGNRKIWYFLLLLIVTVVFSNMCFVFLHVHLFVMPFFALKDKEKKYIMR